MKINRVLWLTLIFVFCGIFFAASVQAFPWTLKMTNGLFNEDPPGAPLPLGRTQYDAGVVFGADGNQIGEYLRVKDVHGVREGLNLAAVTITIFFSQDPPSSITLQGSHSFNTGDELGSVSASSIAGITGLRFYLDGSTDQLTLFP